MASGSKIKDDKQEYQYSLPFVTPSGHEFSFYDTPDNQRLVVKHTSGSHIEFKADGTVFVKSVGDLHTHSSVLSTQSESARGADSSTMRVDADYTLEVGGRLAIKCSELDIEVGSSGRILAGTDLITSANNHITKATESISLEGTKSIYMDTKEVRERYVSRRSEAGTMEDGGQGGINVLNVHGNTIIHNDDEDGGITISSKGYLNLVTGKERVDLTGRWTDRPSQEAVGTWTQKVFTPEGGSLNVSTDPGGDYYFESESSSHYRYSTGQVDGKYQPYGYQAQVFSGDANFDVQTGNYDERVANDKTTVVGMNEFADVGGNRTRNVGGDETVDIQGIQTVTATKIFLN